MIRGHYIAGTGMQLQRRMMENITHNITNADTTGYKKNHLVSRSFEDVMIERLHDPAVRGVTNFVNPPYFNFRNRAPDVGPLNFGTRVDQLFVSYEQGTFEGTERPTDLAIAGDGFFVMDTPAGDRYTRCGAFYLTPDGYVVDSLGNYLLGTEGRLQVPHGEFLVNDRGYVYANNELINQIRIVQFEDNLALRKQGDNLYFVQGGAVPIEAEQAIVKQGFLEVSNVDMAREMVDMITSFRAYESNQRMVSMIDDTIGKAVNEIARLR